MNSKVIVRNCREYDPDEVYRLISEIYTRSDGPDVSNKKVLLKPNVLIDCDPAKCVTTHPVVVEAMIKFLQERNATVIVGDSPGIHFRGFKSEKSGIYQVCQKTGAKWIDFMKDQTDISLGSRKIKIASAAKEADIIISLPKLKTHQLTYFTGAVKNSLGLVPGFVKTKQHAIHSDRDSFSAFLIDLNIAVAPGFYLMDGIMGMEGEGPGQGTPVNTGVLIGSTNPLAVDITACKIVDYDPMIVPTNSIALSKGVWLKDEKDIEYDGPPLESLIMKNFKRIAHASNGNVVVRFLMHRLRSVRSLQVKPVFIHDKCIGCRECIKICSMNALAMHPVKKNWVVLTDNKCIRCFCCSEICQSNAIQVRRNFFGYGVLKKTYSAVRRLF
ncbi:MAG TPA: DUF362 domain-containing protein [Bacteroidales bacterium]|jgi:uncharacterized protein (DUF362 family)/NAD-dependent dihydropyrimidine dehydrogenase PreA subunit|nr:DUF362 domain-containing protein [Bacteroidales bacterium]HQB36897.1 DUF362 domain-containing protein [Bacteroidales bacterium]